MMKFLCPNCKKLSDKMTNYYKEYSVYDCKIKGKDTEDTLKGIVVDNEHISTSCVFCENEFFNYKAKDFLVEIKNNKIIPFGDYWEYHKDELREIKLKEAM